MRRVLVVAGRDSSGRAGLDADLDAARAFQVELAAIATADTIQDERGFHAMNARPHGTWSAEAQVHASGVQAIKFGLLPGVQHVRAAARLVALATGARIVVDPVLAASSGADFADDAMVTAYAAELFALGVIVTPNLPEAARLLALDAADLVQDREARVAAARRLLDGGAAAVVLKDGHGGGATAADLVLERGADPLWLEAARIPGAGIGGSGCRFATALACALVSGASLGDAAHAAGELVRDRIRAANSARPAPERP